MATYEVQGRSAIVTGAGAGIGRAVAVALARNGAAVVVNDCDEDRAQAVVDEIRDTGADALACVGDVTDIAVHRACVATAESLGPLRIAVNNAGAGGETSAVAEYSISSWHSVVDVNLHSTFYGMKTQVPAMAANGGGSIVNMSSVLGIVGISSASAYVTAKHGLLGLTKSAAIDHGMQGIRVNSVGPGFIRTPLLESRLDSERYADLVEDHVMGRLGEPEEVAHLVLFLASDAASFLTAGYYAVDGGYSAR